AVVATAVIAGLLGRRELLAHEVGRDVLVRLLGLLEQLTGFRGVAVLPEGEQSLGVGPGSRGFIGILLEEPCQVVIPVEEEQEAGKSVANALVVAGVEPEHVLQVLHGLLTMASGPEGMRQP